MLPLKDLCVFFYCLALVTGQFPFPKLPELLKGPEFPKLPELPNFSELPTPEEFLEKLLNVTPKELLHVATDFMFDEILYEDIQFLIYDKNGSVTVLDMNSNKHRMTDISEPIKIIIHGWQTTGDEDGIKGMVKSYHNIGIYNVFSVDWSSHSKRNYLHAARGTKKVGEIVGEFIMNLIKSNKKLLPNVHLIGHSLGAQVAGFAGKHIKTLTKGLRIGRITGLDAAAPLFEFPVTVPNHLRLINEDADYVDGIHTNAGFFGFLTPFGKADYYVDFGGPIQAGCMNINAFEAFVCSHIKSHNIYNRTITSKDYLATSCGNPLRALTGLCDSNKRVVMGEHTTTDANGDYFINIDGNGLPERERDIRNVLSKIPVFNQLF